MYASTPALGEMITVVGNEVTRSFRTTGSRLSAATLAAMNVPSMSAATARSANVLLSILRQATQLSMLT
jgi:hypothetical protein